MDSMLDDQRIMVQFAGGRRDFFFFRAFRLALGPILLGLFPGKRGAGT